MKIEYRVRVMAGSLILASLLLSLWVSTQWLWLAAFVGVNLIQSAFTHFCPAEIIFRKLKGPSATAEKAPGTCCR